MIESIFNNLKLKQVLKLTCLLLFSGLLFQCTETKRGCLDINAPNFDVDADEPCEDDCCEKTGLVLSFIHRYFIDDTTAATVRLNEMANIFPDTNHFVSFSQLHFYLTDFQMVKSDGSVLESISTDTIQSEPPLIILDNNVYINRNNVNAQSMGDFIPDAGIQELNFNIGIDGLNNQIIPDSLEISHPFGWKSDSLNWSTTNGYSYFRMEFLTYQNDSTLLDSIPKVIELTSPEVHPIKIVSNFDLQKGLNTRITLLMNYNNLFEGVDIVNDSEMTIKNKVSQNISNSILLDTVNQFQ